MSEPITLASVVAIVLVPLIGWLVADKIKGLKIDVKEAQDSVVTLDGLMKESRGELRQVNAELGRLHNEKASKDSVAGVQRELTSLIASMAKQVDKIESLLERRQEQSGAWRSPPPTLPGG